MCEQKSKAKVQREHELNAACERAMYCLIQRDTTLGPDAVFLQFLYLQFLTSGLPIRSLALK